MGSCFGTREEEDKEEERCSVVPMAGIVVRDGTPVATAEVAKKLPSKSFWCGGACRKCAKMCKRAVVPLIIVAIGGVLTFLLTFLVGNVKDDELRETLDVVVDVVTDDLSRVLKANMLQLGLWAPIIVKNGQVQDDTSISIGRALFVDPFGPALFVLTSRLENKDRTAFENSTGFPLLEIHKNGTFVRSSDRPVHFPVRVSVRRDKVITPKPNYDLMSSGMDCEVLYERQKLGLDRDGVVDSRRPLRFLKGALGRYGLPVRTTFESGGNVYCLLIMYSMHTLLQRAAEGSTQSGLQTLMYEKREDTRKSPLYLASWTNSNEPVLAHDVEYSDLNCTHMVGRDVVVSLKTWHVVMCANDEYRREVDVGLVVSIVILPVVFLMLASLYLLQSSRSEQRMKTLRITLEEERLRGELERANVALQVERETVAYLSHELRNPAQAVTQLAEMLREEDAALGQSTTWQSLQLAAQHMCGVLTASLEIRVALQLCDVAIEPPQGTIEPVCIAGIVRDSLHIARLFNRQTRPELTLTLDYMDPQFCRAVVRKERIQLRQIVSAMISFAVVRSIRGEVIVRSGERHGQAYVEVADNSMQSLGEFHINQSHPPPRTRHEERDLWVAARTARSIGGTLDVQSTIGGCLIVFEMPFEPISFDMDTNPGDKAHSVSRVWRVGAGWSASLSNLLDNVCAKYNTDVCEGTVPVSRLATRINSLDNVINGVHLVVCVGGDSLPGQVREAIKKTTAFLNDKVLIATIDSDVTVSIPRIMPKVGLDNALRLALGKDSPQFEENDIKEHMARLHIAGCDDDPVLVMLLKKTLSCAASVSIFFDGLDLEEYMETLQESQDQMLPDCLLMDIVMKRSRGDEVCRRLRTKGIAIPIIAITGNATTEQISSLVADGFNAVIIKPYKKEELWQAIVSITAS